MSKVKINPAELPGYYWEQLIDGEWVRHPQGYLTYESAHRNDRANSPEWRVVFFDGWIDHVVDWKTWNGEPVRRHDLRTKAEKNRN